MNHVSLPRTPRVARCRQLAAVAHSGQTDKSGEPYIKHPVRVASRVRRASEDAVCAALLHDVVEDTEMTLADVEETAGPRVAELVGLLTHAENEPNADYIARVATDAEACLVKLADLSDNLDPVRMKRLDAATQERLKRKYLAARATLQAALKGHLAEGAMRP